MVGLERAVDRFEWRKGYNSELLVALATTTSGSTIFPSTFGDQPPQTYPAIAGRFDMSHESVRRRVLRALAELRPAAEALAA